MTSKRKKRLLKLLWDHIQQLKKQNEKQRTIPFLQLSIKLKKGLLEKSLDFLNLILASIRYKDCYCIF